MDGLIQFLIVAAILAIGIARQAKKEAAKNKPQPATLPGEAAEEASVPHTYHTYEDILTQQPRSSKNKSEKKSPKPFISEGQRRNLAQAEGEAAIRRAADITSASATASATEASDADSEYALRSADDARRAIIWSEILQRKY